MSDLREACKRAADVLRLLMPEAQLDSYAEGWEAANGGELWTIAEIAAAIEAGNVSLSVAEKLAALMGPVRVRACLYSSTDACFPGCGTSEPCPHYEANRP